jgi:hypothetical protein
MSWESDQVSVDFSNLELDDVEHTFDDYGFKGD